MILTIDATAATSTSVFLSEKGRKKGVERFTRKHHEAEKLLPTIISLLRSKQRNPKDVTGVGVVR